MPAHISKCRVRGVLKWRVRWHEAGRVKRAFHSSRAAADAHAAELNGDAITKRAKIAALPSWEQERLLLLSEEANRRGVDLSGLLTLLSSSPDKPSAVPSISAVLAMMEDAKRNAGRAGAYLKSLRSIVRQFSNGRDALAVDRFNVRDVERFLDSKRIGSRSTLRARLSTLFKFAVRRGYRVDNPCAMIESVTVTRNAPEVFTPDEVQACLKWFKANPRALAWFALSTFAGLRPDEAQKTPWGAIDFAGGLIRVEAQTTKVRMRRVVYPPPLAFYWLRKAKAWGASLPLNLMALRRARKHLRGVLEWDTWKKDVTRHTCASMWLALTGDAAKVAHQLGNSEKVLHRHYKAVTTKDEAEKFWKVPGEVKNKRKKRTKSAAAQPHSPRHQPERFRRL